MQTTNPVMSITDEQIAEIEEYVNFYSDPKIPPQVSYSEIQAIISRLRAAERDSARIDWLGDPSNEIGNVQLPTECVMQNIGSLRDAIDTAMKGDQQ